jgi:hypothetical protein
VARLDGAEVTAVQGATFVTPSRSANCDHACVSRAKWPVSVALDELGHALVVVDRPAGNGVGERESLSMMEAFMGKQTMRQAARLAASQVQAKRRHERAQRDRRLQKLAIEVLTALGGRDATIGATEHRAGAALQSMIIDEHLTVAEAVQWCAGAVNHRERPGFAS